MLRESCSAASAPWGEHLTSREAKAILTLASSPEAGRRLSQDKIAAPLRRAGVVITRIGMPPNIIMVHPSTPWRSTRSCPTSCSSSR